MEDNVCVDRGFGHNVTKENGVEDENIGVEGVVGVDVGEENLDKGENVVNEEDLDFNWNYMRN